MTEVVRSFIAVELPEEVRTHLADIQRQLKKARTPSVKWVDPHSIHLTLKFLGNVETDKLAAITVAIRQSCEGIPPFSLEITGVGAFPNFNRPRVAWVGIKGELDKLIAIQKKLDALLAPMGFPPEDRPFSAHLTLARVRDDMPPPERQAFGKLLQDTKFEASAVFRVDSVNLMRSQLSPSGAIYTRLDSVKLVVA